MGKKPATINRKYLAAAGYQPRCCGDKYKIVLELSFPLNPFSDAYLAQEIAFYALPSGVHRFGTVESRYIRKPDGRLDDYFNEHDRVQLPPIPTFFIDRKVWMSLAPIEVQSCAVAIAMAEGRIATAGLGMGYFALRAAAKPAVEEVIVYELNGDVIAAFNALFGQRPERQKITVIKGDVRELMRGRSFDMVYMDPYPDLLPDEVVGDAQLFRATNTIGHYRFWGIERVLLDALVADENPYLFPWEAALFKAWLASPLREGEPQMMRDFYTPLTDAEFRAQVMAVIDHPAERHRLSR
jgi:hypothetical protein